MKRTLALLLACVMLFAFAGCATSPSAEVPSGSPTGTNTTSPVVTSPPPSGVNPPPVDRLPTQAEALANADLSMATGSITIGDISQLNADFYFGWTNSSPNARIKELIHYGYETVVLMDPGYWGINPVVVKEWNAVTNDDGSKMYQFTIYDNLKYNDGTDITAMDYVFNMLFSNSKEFDIIAPGNAGGELYVGFEQFLHQAEGYVNADGDFIYTDKDGNPIPLNEDGEPIDPSLVVPCRTFKGVSLFDKYTFGVTYKAEELPFYYELAGVSVGPLPMHVLAPDVTIKDDGKGCTISENFTVELLQQTVLDRETGYRYNPKVTSGPYNFYSYDAKANIAIVKANPYYLGNYDGSRPRIETIILKKVEEATMLDELATGQVDLLNTVSGGAKIDKGLDLVDAGKVAYHDYPRAGFGKIVFHCDFSPTQFAAVRQAIAYCLDRNEFARAYTGGYGIVVDGYYGASLWEYIENRDELDAKLNHYSYNLAKAKELLIADGWTLNATGGAYVEGSGVRYKKLADGSLMPLVIQWFSSANSVAALLTTNLLPEVEKVGMKIEVTEGDFATLLDHYYRDSGGEPVYSMYNMGVGFSTMHSPWYYYDPKYNGLHNTNFIDDKELYNLTQDMKKVASDDKAGWSAAWVKMQIRWNELMPDIPLYSDLYHDFYTPKLVNFNSGPLWGWSYAIQRASLTK